jgi:hypothetical protein
MSFRDGAEVVSSTLALGLGADGALARIRVGLDDVCEDAEIARITADSILFLILGQVWHKQQRMQADSLGVVAAAVASKPEDVRMDVAGHNENSGQAASSVVHGQSDSLEFGIGLILDGLEKKLTLKHGSR